jgi:hypothetical protein
MTTAFAEGHKRIALVRMTLIVPFLNIKAKPDINYYIFLQLINLHHESHFSPYK